MRRGRSKRSRRTRRPRRTGWYGQTGGRADGQSSHCEARSAEAIPLRPHRSPSTRFALDATGLLRRLGRLAMTERKVARLTSYVSRLTSHVSRLPAPLPAALPVAQAHRKLYPPMGPKASRASPQMNRPGCRRLSIVRGSISARLTPRRSPRPSGTLRRRSRGVHSGRARRPAGGVRPAAAAPAAARPQPRPARSACRPGDRAGAAGLPRRPTGFLRPQQGFLPAGGIQGSPSDQRPGPRPRLRQPGADGHVGHVEHGRPAVALVGEQEPAGGGGSTGGVAGGDGHRQRNPRERREGPRDPPSAVSGRDRSGGSCAPAVRGRRARRRRFRWPGRRGRRSPRSPGRR